MLNLQGIYNKAIQPEVQESSDAHMGQLWF